MDVGGDLTLQWVEEVGNVELQEEVICDLEAQLVATEEEVIGACEEVAVEETVESAPDIASATESEILMVPQSSDMESIYIVPQDQGHDYLNIQVTEEVIADNWDRQGPDDGIEIPEAKVTHDNLLEYDDMEIPLPINQDSNTNIRPYPCDFCSRRFRKKANLMNHMVAHQTDRPHSCNLCGARYVRRCDLNNHLKIHAYAPLSRDVPEDNANNGNSLAPEEDLATTVKGRRKKVQSSVPRKRKGNNVAGLPKRNNTDDVSGVKMEMGNGNYASSSRWHEEMSVSSEQQSPRWPVTDPTKPYVCQFCGVGFAREKALASHARIHGGDSPFECTSCSEMFWDVNSLREHVRIKHGGTMPQSDTEEYDDTAYTGEERFGEFYCNTCAVPFHRLDLLKRHQKIHIKQEMDTMEGSSQHHVCNVCGEWFEEALALLAHAELHARSPSRRCLLCGARCRDDADVAEHLRQNHAEDAPPNTCTLCGKTCKDKRSLLKHSWVHNVDKTFGCTKCGKRFHSKARLRRHMVSHRNKMVACDECGEEFPDGRALVSHRHSHNKDLGGRSFPCRECGKTFGSRSSQQIHIRIHTGERPYGCRFCWKAFADGGTLRKHERIHTGEKPYGCAICPRAFNQRVVLREHVRAHHSGPDPKCVGSAMPFLCKVCGEAYGTSEEIVAHIVQHCDDNTALRRQPQTGPRKYKRRRKLKPHETNTILRRNELYDVIEGGDGSVDGGIGVGIGVTVDVDAGDGVGDGGCGSGGSGGGDVGDGGSESEDNTKRKLGRKNKQHRSNVEEGYQNVLKSFESSLQNINSIVSNSKLNMTKSKLSKKKLRKEEKKSETQTSNQSGRPKMIHTQKTRVPVEVGSDGVKKGQKTKTMVTRTPKVMPNEHKSAIFLGGERNRPRTKNVSYHIEGKQQLSPATFSKVKEDADPISAQQSQQQLLLANVKIESGAQKASTGDSHRNNNGNMLTLVKKKSTALKKTKRQKHILKQERSDTSESGIEEQQQQQHQLQLRSNNVIENNDDPGRLMEHAMDGSNLEVAFEANVVTAEGQEEDEDDDEEEERILPDTGEEIGNGDVKLSVKVESTPQRMLAVHSVITPVDDVPETIIPDAVEYTCEMCAAVFSSRAELLVHVPIHI